MTTVVWERKEIDPPPSLHGVQGLDAPDQEAMGGRREGSRVEAPQGTLGQVAVEGEICGGSFGLFR